MRTIRVKDENQQLIIAALQAAGFAAEPCEPHFPDVWAYRSYPGENWEQEQLDLQEIQKGMTGILTSASGHQAHKVINKLLNR